LSIRVTPVPETRYRPSGERARLGAAPSWPGNCFNSFPTSTSHNRTRPFSSVASRLRSFVTARALCPDPVASVNARGSRPDPAPQRRTGPEETERAGGPSGERATGETAPRCPGKRRTRAGYFGGRGGVTRSSGAGFEVGRDRSQTRTSPPAEI